MAEEFKSNREIKMNAFRCPKCLRNVYAVFGEYESRNVYGICLMCHKNKSEAEIQPTLFTGYLSVKDDYPTDVKNL